MRIEGDTRARSDEEGQIGHNESRARYRRARFTIAASLAQA
jgi:hypothetical protein